MVKREKPRKTGVSRGLSPLRFFAEKIDDMSPISTLANLTYFLGWNMDGRTMATALDDLSTAKQPVDVPFVKSLPKLKHIALRGTEVVNGSAIPASVKVYSGDKTKGL